MEKMKNADIDTTFNSAQLLSIPSQRVEPPTHSTPKRTDINDGRPIFDESSISSCDTDHNRTTISTKKADDVYNNNNKRSRKVPKLEKPEATQPTSRPVSSASVANTISSTAPKNLLGIERNKSSLNFGYVPIGQSLILRQKVWNCDKEKMHIKCSILFINEDEEFSSDHFKIVNVSAPIMRPGESCEIEVQYAPIKVERNLARLALERINGNSLRYSFTLIGNGGNADLRFDRNFEEGIAFQATSSRAMIIRPDIFNRFWLTFENKGQRSAFVFLIATDRRGNILSREAGQDQQKISIQPAQFVLDPLPSASDIDTCESVKSKHNLNVLIRVDEAFDWTLDEEDESMIPSLNSSQPLIKNGKQQTNNLNLTKIDNQVRKSICGRDSILSSASTTSLHSDYAFQIHVYWGEESQRQRLKYWEREFRPYLLGGLRFTGHFQNEHEMNIEQKGRLQKCVHSGDAQQFRDTLRIRQFNVIDERARVYFPSEQQPLLNMFRNKSILLRQICPGEETSLMNGSATMMLSPQRTKDTSTRIGLSKLPCIFEGKRKQNF